MGASGPRSTAGATDDHRTEADPSGSTDQTGRDAVRSWGWHALQVSSWLLVVMLPIHILSIWVLHDPGRFGVATFVDRWHSSGWRLFDWAFLMLALLHGGLGLSGLLATVIRNETARIVIAAVLATAFTALALLVSATIFSFDVA